MIAGSPNSGMAPTYQAQRRDHFRSWLLSLRPTEAQEVTSPSTVSLIGERLPGPCAPGQPLPAVELVGRGSLGAAAAAQDYVSARLLSVKFPTGTNPSGRYGWWVGDESQKARIMEDSYNSKPAQTLAEKISRSQAPGSTGTTTVKGLETLTTDRQLKGLPSLKSLDLVSGATGKPAENFHSVTPFSSGMLADVREGGLKRDLSTLLERDINIAESGDDFMLYKFGSNSQQQVPIQDLAAFYQLYDNSRNPLNGGLRYSSNLISNGMQVVSPDYGDVSRDAFARQYTTLYRQPMPIKVQFLLSLFAELTGATATTANPSPDTHYLRVGITPSVML